MSLNNLIISTYHSFTSSFKEYKYFKRSFAFRQISSLSVIIWLRRTSAAFFLPHFLGYTSLLPIGRYSFFTKPGDLGSDKMYHFPFSLWRYITSCISLLLATCSPICV